MANAIDNVQFGTNAAAGPETARTPRLGQADFFRLLIAQLQNQDPFKPLASGEFLSQIAQFSTVAGVQDLQRSFEQLSSSLYSNQALQASALIGRTVYVPGPEAALGAGSGEGVSGLVELGAATSGLTVGVYDAAGSLVRRIALGPQPAGSIAFHWDGLTENGTPAAPGLYRLRAEAVMGRENVALEVFVAARVESVTLGRAGADITLNLAGLGAVDFAQVRRVQ
jgi:flagellar basal-body rod modification protein FlgD